jgi:hypothetical protein
VIGAAGLRDALTAEGLVPMDSVDDGPVAVVQGLGPDVSCRRLAEGSRAVRAGLFWMATNLDLTVPTVHGPAPGNGVLVRAVATAGGRGPDEVAGKPLPGAFLEAARRAGSTRPLVVGDRLDTDLEGARAAGMPGLLVLTGVTGTTELLAAPAALRPTYVGRDLLSLQDPHPAARADLVDGGALGRCGDAVVQVEPEGDQLAVHVESAGDDGLDLLRAATVAVWCAVDAGETRPVDGKKLIVALQAVEPGAGWAR